MQRSCQRRRWRSRDARRRHRWRRAQQPRTAGVAPNVTLVNLRAGQDLGFFFLQATVDALTYAGDNGIDVVNMSYFIDPWLYNCAANQADSPAAQLEQRTIVAATNRALDYAWKRGVTLIGAEGNQHTDLGSPTVDTISPDFPPGLEYPRNVDNSCLSMPTEGNNVISIGAVGSEHDKSGLLELGSGADGGDRAGRVLPRLLRYASAPADHEPRPLDVPRTCPP